MLALFSKKIIFVAIIINNIYNINAFFMKKILFAMMVAIVALSSFSSCKEDEDRDIAMILSGKWEGNFGATYSVSISGSRTESYSTKTTSLTFDPHRDYGKRGSGLEVDNYGSGAPIPELVYEFFWSVNERVIHFEFPDYEGMDFDICDYELDSEYFRGTINGKKFKLRKVSDYYDWTPYKDYHSLHPDQPSSGHDIQD